MLDVKRFRADLAGVAQGLAKRHVVLDVQTFAALEEQRKSLQKVLQEAQSERNSKSKTIGMAKAKGEDIAPLLADVEHLGEQMKTAEAAFAEVDAKITELLLAIPNIPHDSVPAGKGEEDNVEVSRWGIPRQFEGDIQDHVALAETRGWLNNEEATKVTGARFSVMKGAGARLHRALIQFMLDQHTLHHGYTETYVPYLVNADSMRGTGQLPKFEEDLFKITMGEGDSRQFYLIPTAEVPVTNLLRDEIVNETDLPIRYTAHTPCFRSEAGSAGRDTRGLIRQHQFEKVEMVQFAHPEASYSALEELTGHAEKILQLLELPYRKMLLCAGDMGFSAAKTYDLEVWLPAQDKYREISSCSNFEDFQARRLQARFKTKEGKPQLLHTLNGSGLAVGRTWVALVENGQQANGKIYIPVALRPYLGGVAEL
ncbi:MAG: serine--tRNA ligase [Proteobacteria bacterium]|nr:serine--tRNA ligase [Pseudomonadota bacterium]